MRDETASLTELLGDYGALWEISRSRTGFRARRRPAPAPPVVFTAPSVAALRSLLEHGYDTGMLAGISQDFGTDWQVERVDPGSAWLAVSRAGAAARLIVADDLAELRVKLDKARRDTP